MPASSASTDRLQAALRELESTHTGRPTARQRRFTRYAVRAEAWLEPLRPGAGNEQRMPIHVREISRGGVGVLANAPLEVGTSWRLNLVADGMPVATLPVFCRHCRCVLHGAYLIGLEFGIDAAILLALGVEPRTIAVGEEPEYQHADDEEFVDPRHMLGEDAA